jgi:hypothetical protein
MSDFILARVSQTLATEHSLEMLVRQLLEMLELVTRMESTYLTRIDLNAQRQLVMYAHNSSEMQIPEGFRCRGMSRCVNVQSMITASSVTMSTAAGVVHRRSGAGDHHLLQHSRAPRRWLAVRHAVCNQPQ